MDTGNNGKREEEDGRIKGKRDGKKDRRENRHMVRGTDRHTDTGATNKQLQWKRSK